MRLLTISLASVVPISAALPKTSVSAARNETGNAIVLTWLQRRATLDASWTNIGIPSPFATTLIEPSDQAGFYRVVQDYTAQYRVTFNATWSSSTHPAAFPGGAHWSGLVGGVHNDRVHSWREGETASLGIQNMAERGIQSTLVSEINPVISGASYSSPDLATTPRGIITRFTDFPALVNGEIVPFGTFTFTRLD